MSRLNSSNKKDEEEPTTTRTSLSWSEVITTQFEELQNESFKNWIPKSSLAEGRSSQVSWISLLWEGNSTPRNRNTNELNPPSPVMNRTSSLNEISAKIDTQRRKLAIGRRGTIVVCLLLFLGLRELLKSSSGGSKHISVKGRNPFAVLSDLAAPPSRSLGALSPLTHQWMSNSVGRPGENTADTTAIVLNWKRTENVGVIIASLCQYSFFDSILIWNNNPDLHLTREVSSSFNSSFSR